MQERVGTKPVMGSRWRGHLGYRSDEESKRKRRGFTERGRERGCSLVEVVKGSGILSEKTLTGLT